MKPADHQEQPRYLASTITANIDNTRVVRSFLDKSDALRLLVERDNVQIKIELSPVLRGTVYDPQVMPVSGAVEDEFGFAEMPVVNFADLYAGKICAALDRQHPRDLFDVKQLLDNEGSPMSFAKPYWFILLATHVLLPNYLDQTSRTFQVFMKESFGIWPIKTFPKRNSKQLAGIW